MLVLVTLLLVVKIRRFRFSVSESESTSASNRFPSVGAGVWAIPFIHEHIIPRER